MYRASCIVRLEVTLDAALLQKVSLVPLDASRDGYEQGLYEAIFHGTVRLVLHLDEDLPCGEIRALAATLTYPGDYHPNREHEVGCVCRATWADHLSEVRKLYLRAW